MIVYVYIFVFVVRVFRNGTPLKELRLSHKNDGWKIGRL